MACSGLENLSRESHLTRDSFEMGMADDDRTRKARTTCIRSRRQPAFAHDGAFRLL